MRMEMGECVDQAGLEELAQAEAFLLAGGDHEAAEASIGQKSLQHSF